VAIANVGKVSGITVPSATYTSANSVLFDGTNDYAETVGLNCPTAAGTVSMWFKFGTNNSTEIFFQWTNFPTTGNIDNSLGIRVQAISGNPAAYSLIGIYEGDNSGGQVCSMKATTSDHGSGFSRWKYNYQDLTGFSSHERFMYNANRLLQSGSHSFSPSEGSEHGWHHLVLTWNVNEVYTGKDAQAAHKFRPTASDDGTTTNHTGTMKIYMDGTLRNFGQSAFPSHNYQRTPIGMTEMTSNSVDTIRFGSRFNNTFHAHMNIDDAAVFDTDIDADAVLTMYNSGVPIDLTSNSGDYDYASNLIGYWKFDETSGTTIADSSSNSNDLTLYNSPTFDVGDAPS
jgi:hypothetical protein